ncbi:hypothetical protein CF319_g9343 [Tilletia indica]|nr:hypothetical protein CF319_g9343 [Tilletia indica]
MIDIIPTGLALGRAPWRHSAHLKYPWHHRHRPHWSLDCALGDVLPTSNLPGITDINHTGFPSVALPGVILPTSNLLWHHQHHKRENETMIIDCATSLHRVDASREDILFDEEFVKSLDLVVFNLKNSGELVHPDWRARLMPFSEIKELQGIRNCFEKLKGMEPLYLHIKTGAWDGKNTIRGVGTAEAVRAIVKKLLGWQSKQPITAKKLESKLSFICGLCGCHQLTLASTAKRHLKMCRAKHDNDDDDDEGDRQVHQRQGDNTNSCATQSSGSNNTLSTSNTSSTTTNRPTYSNVLIVNNGSPSDLAAFADVINKLQGLTLEKFQGLNQS